MNPQLFRTQLQEQAAEGITRAILEKDLENLLINQEDYSYTQDPTNLEWMEKLTLKTYNAVRTNSTFLKPVKQAAETARTLYSAFSEPNSKVQVGLRRIRNGDLISYAVLSRFPGSDNLIYLASEVACLSHSCDLLFTKSRQSVNGKVIGICELPYIEKHELWNTNPHFGDQDPGRYLQAASHGIFINIPRYIIPEVILKEK
jgi:hypothetical protein